MGEQVDIGADIGAAIQGYVAALRHLDRCDTSTGEIAKALNIPPMIVERAFSEFRIIGAKLSSTKKRLVTVSRAEFFPVVELKRRKPKD